MFTGQNRFAAILLLALCALMGCTSSTPTPPATATATPAATSTTVVATATRAVPSPTATSTPPANADQAKIIQIGDLELVIQIPDNKSGRTKYLSIPASSVISNPDGSIGTMTAYGANTKPLPIFGQKASHSRVIDAVPGGNTVDISIVPNLGICTMVIQYRTNIQEPYMFFAYYDVEGDTQPIFLPR